MTVYLDGVSLRSEKHLGRCMKHSKLVRVAALVAATSLIASCGSGSESSDTTERTRNTTVWTASTTPSKVVVYGTQDGLIEYVSVPNKSGDVTPTRITQVEPNTTWWNAVVTAAVDTSRSEVIFGGNSQDGKAYVSKVNTDGTGQSLIYEETTSLVFGMGYDPVARIIALNHNKSGDVFYMVHSADEVNSPLRNSVGAYYALPLLTSYGAGSLITTGSTIRLVQATNPTRIFSSSGPLSSTPYDMWTFAKDTMSDFIYGGRQRVGELVQTKTDAGTAITTVRPLVSPASLAVFSDGTIAVGKGTGATDNVPVVGALTIVDPSGGEPDIEVGGVGSGEAASGLQSVWAVESPIANTPPQVDGDFEVGGSIYCGDAQWRDDLPLSRLSRKPIEGVRSYAWFRNGVQMEGVTSETIELSEGGSYQCAVTAGNLAGSGQSAQSEAFVVPSLPSDESTSTTVEGSGGSEASPVESPVVTVPVAAPATPVVVVTPTLRSAKWTFIGRTVKVTFRKYSGATKYRLYVRGATRKNIVCKSAKTTVTCTTTTLKKGLNSFSAKALSTSGVTLALSTKTRLTK